ncbi:MAG: hypothetical protein IJG31_02465 [Fusobacterium sp.]|nr:hypothetical protein [Fusobacterium sp.]
MKKYILICIFLLSSLAFAINDLSTLKTLKFNAEEKQLINGREKLIKYSVTIEFPKKIRKEINFPELNKGEVYVYENNLKKVYLPIFDEYKETDIDADENKIIQAINKLIFLEKDEKFKKEYQSKKLKAFKLDENENTIININTYLEKDNYILPENIEIIDDNISLGTVFIRDIEINIPLNKEIFYLKKGKK